MNLKKTISVAVLIFFSYQIFAQLTVKSDFNKEDCRLNIEITNKSQYILLFMTEQLLDPPYISIESFDSKGNNIEWLQHPPLGHGGPYLFNSMYLHLRQNESYLLSYKINPDKNKRSPEYFIVTYSLPFRKIDAENIEMERLVKQRYKYLVGNEKLSFKERFDFETFCR